MDTKQKLTDIRNQLYNDMETGNVNAFNLIKAIKNHLDELDNFIDNVLPSEGNPANSEPANCAIFDVSQQREQLAILALERISKAHSESFSAGVASEVLYKIANCG
jgi:hypothetical protein